MKGIEVFKFLSEQLLPLLKGVLFDGIPFIANVIMRGRVTYAEFLANLPEAESKPAKPDRIQPSLIRGEISAAILRTFASIGGRTAHFLYPLETCSVFRYQAVA